MLTAFAYHNVAISPPRIDRWGITVTKGNFELQVRAISRYMEFVDLSNISLSEAVDSKRQYALITFDDIYSSILTNALPLLIELKATPILFIASSLIDKPQFWWGQLEALFAHLSQEERIETIDYYWSTLRYLPLEECETVMRHLIGLSEGTMSSPEFRPVTKGELVDLLRHPSVFFGGHTANHPWLPALSPQQMIHEIQVGTDFVTQMTGKKPLAFSYPYGVYNSEAIRAVSESGYTFAFSMESPFDKQHDQRRCNLLAFPRLCVGDWSGEQLGNILKDGVYQS